MGSSLQIWQKRLINKQVPITTFIFFLSVFIFIHVISSIEGRGIQAPLMEGKKAEAADKVGMMGSQIGSRPPICRRRCRQCGGHCEAIQVPVALHDSHQNQRKRSSSHYFSAAVETLEGSSKHGVALSSEEDETSNYKPISWKCKCGNFIFNP